MTIITTFKTSVGPQMMIKLFDRHQISRDDCREIYLALKHIGKHKVKHLVRFLENKSYTLNDVAQFTKNMFNMAYSTTYETCEFLCDINILSRQKIKRKVWYFIHPGYPAILDVKQKYSATFFKLLSNDRNFDIISLLWESISLSNSEIENALNIDQTTLSNNHLRYLRAHGILKVKKDGRNKVNDVDVDKLIDVAKTIAQYHKEINMPETVKT